MQRHQTREYGLVLLQVSTCSSGKTKFSALTLDCTVDWDKQILPDIFKERDLWPFLKNLIYFWKGNYQRLCLLQRGEWTELLSFSRSSIFLLEGWVLGCPPVFNDIIALLQGVGAPCLASHCFLASILLLFHLTLKWRAAAIQLSLFMCKQKKVAY